MKTRVFQFLAIGLLASLVVVAALALRPLENGQSAGVPVTGNSSPAIDFNNPNSLPVDLYMVPNEADSIDLQSEQYHRQYQITEPVDSRPILPIDFNNPLSLPVDPYMNPVELPAVSVLSIKDEAYRARYQITDPAP